MSKVTTAFVSLKPSPSRRVGNVTRSAADLVDFDHTSLAVDDLDRWSTYISDMLGATPIDESASSEFRYRLFATGPECDGSRLELLAPAHSGPDGFLQRFLERYGTGPHHLTFTVPNVEQWGPRIAALGLAIVGMDLSKPEWREAFVRPDQVHGTLIQIADSSGSAVSAPSTDRDPRSLGMSRSDAPSLCATTLYSTDLETSRQLFGNVLLGREVHVPGGWDFVWNSGVLRVRQAATPMIGPLELDRSVPTPIRVGSANFVGRAENRPQPSSW